MISMQKHKMGCIDELRPPEVNSYIFVFTGNCFLMTVEEPLCFSTPVSVIDIVVFQSC